MRETAVAAVARAKPTEVVLLGAIRQSRHLVLFDNVEEPLQALVPALLLLRVGELPPRLARDLGQLAPP